MRKAGIARQGWKRLPVELNEQLYEYLGDVSRRTQNTLAETIRRSILVYGWAVEQASRGAEVVSVDASGNVVDSCSGEPSLRLMRMYGESQPGASVKPTRGHNSSRGGHSYDRSDTAAPGRTEESPKTAPRDPLPQRPAGHQSGRRALGGV